MIKIIIYILICILFSLNIFSQENIELKNQIDSSLNISCDSNSNNQNNNFQFEISTELINNDLSIIPNQNSSKEITPIIELKPDTLTLHKPKDSKFIITEIKILNRGGNPLIIDRINSSCKCASGKVIENEVLPMTFGKIIISINLDGLYENNNLFVFSVESNAKNSPALIKIRIE